MIYTDGINLIADDIDELHDFAKSIGLKRGWFRNHPTRPRYDIWDGPLQKALRSGKVGTVSPAFINEFFKKSTIIKS